MRLSWMALSAAALALAGCTTGLAPSAGGGATSTTSSVASDGEARKLKPGMTPNDAFTLFGPESGFERNPDNFDQSCLSYAYGATEAPRYVHAQFVNDVLVSATDGHPAICTFAEPLAPLG